MLNVSKSALSRLFTHAGFIPDAFYLHKVFSDRKVIVYGAGESFHYFKETVMRRYGYRPSLIMDIRFSTGDIYEGIPACSPLSYEPTPEDCINALVVVCLGKQKFFDEVVQKLQKMGFKSIISLMDIYEIHNPFCAPDELDKEGFLYYLNRQDAIESCFNMLEDDQSRDIYITCLQTHMQRKPVPVPMSERSEQYTPDDIFLVKGADRLVYCGVSVGELERVLGSLGKVSDLVCFEPDPNQFALASAFLAKHRDLATKISIFPCAVFSHESIEPFTFTDTSFGSRILLTGGSSVQTVSLDHVLPGFNPTYIIMDIEGAELEALKGAEETIRSSRPDLAICVYHSPSHLWEIPLFLERLGVGYRFFLRNYTSLTGETVLYAVS
jgi:FkbM family methyltransferase